MIKHSQITQGNEFAISLQHFKKEIRNGGHFWHADKRQSFCKLVLSFLVKVARHVEIPKIGSWQYFYNIWRKDCRNCFVFYSDAKHSDILRWSLIFVVTC